MGIFGHGVTYGGHPVACAVALKTIEIYERMGIESVVAAKGAVMESALSRFRGAPGIRSVRRVGMIAAVEIDPASGLTGADVGAEAEARGVFLRIVGDSLCICPPYVIEDAEIGMIADVIEQSIAICQKRKAA